MELLKDKIDKTSSCVKLFTNTQWIISFDDNCTTPTSDDDIEYYEMPHKFDNNFIEDRGLSQPVQPFIQPVQPFIQAIQPVQPFIQPVQPVEPVETVQPVEPFIQPLQSVVQPVIQPIQPVQSVIQPVELVQPVETVEPICNIKINKIDNNKLSPLEFFKQTLDLYDDDDIIRTKLFDFISTQKISIKYTKKGVSMIMDGITQNKWNIYICKLFSFLLDISFEYRKQQICETKHSNFIIKK